MTLWRIRTTIAAIAVAIGALALAASPDFNGTWKLNMAKSQLTGQTLTIEKKTGDLMHFDSQGFGYDFDLSGKDFPTPDGGTTSWKAINATTWEATNKMNGKAIGMFHMTVEGNTMTAVLKATKADGSPLEQTFKLTRESGGPGFLGKWKSTEAKGAATSMVIVTSGDTISISYRTFRFPARGSSTERTTRLSATAQT